MDGCGTRAAITVCCPTQFAERGEKDRAQRKIEEPKADDKGGEMAAVLGGLSEVYAGLRHEAVHGPHGVSAVHSYWGRGAGRGCGDCGPGACGDDVEM